MVEKGLIKNTRTDVKVLGQGELTKKLAVTAHAFSATAREKIEQAGGSVTALRPPREEKKRRRKAAPATGAADEPEEATAEAEPAAEAEAPEAEDNAEETSE